jgi:amidase
MCRTVTDAAILLGALRGVDPSDPATRASAPQAGVDYLARLPQATLRGVRLGIVRKGGKPSAKAAPVYDQALDALKRAGAELIEPTDLPDLEELGPKDFQDVMSTEFRTGVEAYLALLGPGSPKTIKDLIEFNLRERAREMPYFGQEFFERCVAKEPLPAEVYEEAVGKFDALARKGIDDLLTQHRLDALIAPTGEPAWVTDHVYGDRFGDDPSFGRATGVAAAAGYPHITVPMGQVQGLPVGLSFIGTAWSEARLLEIAFAFERETRARKPPRFLPTI